MEIAVLAQIFAFEMDRPFVVSERSIPFKMLFTSAFPSIVAIFA